MSNVLDGLKAALVPYVRQFVKRAESNKTDLSQVIIPADLEHEAKTLNLKFKTSFGMGTPTNIPWLACFVPGQTASAQGVYPVILYRRDTHSLSVNYGVSATAKSGDGDWPINWPNELVKNLDHFDHSKYKESYTYEKFDEDIDEYIEDIIQSFTDVISDFINLYHDSKTLPSNTPKKYWICGLGPGAKYWEECKAQNIAVFGFDNLPSLSTFKTKDEITSAIKAAEGSENPINDTLAAWQIPNEINVGDVLIAKQGKSLFLGYGVVTGPFYYDNSRESYRNVIPVDWKKVGKWPETEGTIVLKTLTDITPHPDYVQRLMQMFDGTINTPATDSINDIPLNLIIYGPPGTGKTHRLKTQYFDEFTSFQQQKTKDDYADEIASEYNWWELIAMALFELGESKVAQIITHPVIQAKIRKSRGKNTHTTVWNVLSERTKLDCENVNTAVRYEPKIFWKNSGAVWSVDKDLVQEELSHLVEKLDAYHNYKGLQTDIKRYLFTTFHQSYSYEEFVEGIKPCLTQSDSAPSGDVSYEIKSGIFKDIVSRAISDPHHSYAIFIDEISRGNVASIFGELITLIEDDKRYGAENELSATLPYSREEFVVPQNLHIIGTMNTADRSVVALDNALRRRFSFIEMMPEPDKIQQPSGFEVDLKKLLTTINGRLEKLLDRDHVIGHSYFMRIADAENSLSELQHIFANKVLPLLQEYFYGDPSKIGMVLGESFIQIENNGIQFATGSWGEDDWEERPTYRFADPFDLLIADYQSIYAK